MKNIFERLNVWYVAVIVLFGISLCFSSTREAHGLCVRLLLHLRGATFVQGNPGGCIIYTIPSVQFTEKFQQDLRSHSTNSLDDFVLASTTGDCYGLESPLASLSWSNHPLLEWGALRMAWISCFQYSELDPTNLPATNAIAMAAMANALKAVHIAQTSDPTNGALWLAEADICFAQKQDQSGLVALGIAATNRNWNANLASTYVYITRLLENKGLSKLDAAGEANILKPDSGALAIQSGCMRFFGRSMVAALQDDDKKQFSSLLELCVELRKAEWTDQGCLIPNYFRNMRRGDDLVNLMAKQMGRNVLPESDTFPYEQRRTMSEQIFRDYLYRYVDLKTAASFLTQGEAYKTEKNLRGEIEALHYRPLAWSSLYSSLSGALCLLALSFFGMALLFEIVARSLRKYPRQTGGQCPPKSIWMLVALVLIANVAVFTNFWISTGLGNEVGLRLIEPPSVIGPNMQGLLLGLFVSAVWLGVLLQDWLKSKVPIRLWLIPLWLASAYLAAVFGMAYFRSETVGNITAGFL